MATNNNKIDVTNNMLNKITLFGENLTDAILR